jgi:hypothetical protein
MKKVKPTESRCDEAKHWQPKDWKRFHAFCSKIQKQANMLSSTSYLLSTTIC